MGEATQAGNGTIRNSERFQSTLPVGEATDSHFIGNFVDSISIHASRGGSDRSILLEQNKIKDFNPRFPWGKRPGRLREVCKGRGISIHASRGGSDFLRLLKIEKARIFQSTLPVGEATDSGQLLPELVFISIHASRGGSDFSSFSAASSGVNFNPRFPWGKRPSARLQKSKK